MIISSILISAGMRSGKSSDYIGNGATLGDLNSDILVGTAAGIKKYYGEDACRSFTVMVWRMKVLFVYALIENMYRLKNNKWSLVGLELYTKDHPSVYSLIPHELMVHIKKKKVDETRLIRSSFPKV